jgi:TonB family protein
MFRLLESSPRKHRNPKEAAVSVAVHAGLIAALIYATAQQGDVFMSQSGKVENITFAVPQAAKRAAPAPAPPRQAPPRPTAQPTQAPAMPIEEAGASDLANANVTGLAVDGAGERDAYYDYEVGMAAASLGGGIRPRYPEQLRHQRLEGRVEVEFVVDERGRVDMRTVKVIESTHDLFTAAVQRALGGMRFSPAKVGGKPVRQYVRLPVIFKFQG